MAAAGSIYADWLVPTKLLEYLEKGHLQHLLLKEDSAVLDKESMVSEIRGWPCRFRRLLKEHLQHILGKLGLPFKESEPNNELIDRIVKDCLKSGIVSATYPEREYGEEEEEKKSKKKSAYREWEVPTHLLKLLTVDQINDLLPSLPRGTYDGVKKPLKIWFLRQGPIVFRHLKVSHLKQILKKLREETNGRKEELIDRIVGCKQAGVKDAVLPEEDSPDDDSEGEDDDVHDPYPYKCTGEKPKPEPPLQFVDEELIIGDLLRERFQKPKLVTPFEAGPMTTTTFRSKMKALGLELEVDQHVCHIISESNGGANHSDNYFVASQNFNMATGNRHDALMCFIVGKVKAMGAVDVSKEFGNTKYGKYDVKRYGDGQELYKKGQDAYRDLHTHGRK